MPSEKDFKRLIRARMAKTGESYTTARAHLIDKRDPLPPDHESLAGMSDAAVADATGRTWLEWVRALDAEDAASLPHADIAALVSGRFGVGDWWTQMVTVGYERLRGLRAVGQRRDGGWEANKSRTYPVPAERLFRAFADPEERQRWLPDSGWTHTAVREDTSIRGAWPDGTRVNAYFTGKGSAKSTVSVQHEKLPDAAARDDAKEAWGERLDRLGRFLAADDHGSSTDP